MSIEAVMLVMVAALVAAAAANDRAIGERIDELPIGYDVDYSGDDSAAAVMCCQS